MAKFQLIIEADDEDDLVAGVSRLAALLGEDEIVDAAGVEIPGAARKGRPRTARRTAAANGGSTSTAAGEATAASGVQAGLGSAGVDAGPTATTVAPPSEPTGPTKESVMAKMQEAIAACGALKAQEALVGAGLAKNISGIAPEQYTAAINALDGAIALS